MKKTIRVSVDRAEGEILVLIPDEGNAEIRLKKGDFDLTVGDVADVTLEDEKILSVQKCEEEKRARTQDMGARLASLFAKGKKPGR